MPGLIINGVENVVPGLKVVNWKDDPKLRLKMPEDGRPRVPPRVGCVTVHSTLGAPDSQNRHPQTLLPGLGPSTNAGEYLVDMWSKDGRCAGAALGVDFDGTVYCLCDLVTEESYHATTANQVSIGIEIKQGVSQSEFYEGQIAAVVTLVNYITAYLGIQRQMPGAYTNKPVPRLATGAKDFYGVFGHRDQSDNRGFGDPGDFVMTVLEKAGYERFNLFNNDDITAWKKRQAWLGFPASKCDGIPGPQTTAALKAKGFDCGLWVCPPSGLQLP